MTATVNNPITVAGIPLQTDHGIRADTTSRGNDLAGALIVATYIDGTTENLTWAAFDRFTLGGATGTDIVMSFGFGDQTLTTTKRLASLKMDLAPASSVFDITLTGESDLNGINTPTSKNGYPFQIVSYDVSETGSVTATYSNTVSLTGHPAAGDLFTTMFIDFSGLASGGILGELKWRSDIDTLATAGDLVRVPPVVTTTTVADLNDEFLWTSYTDTFEDGVLVLRELTFDSGKQLDTSFTNGVKSSTLTTDTADTEIWQTQASRFNTLGQRTGLTETYDDGRVLEATYEGGIKTQATTTDTLNVYNWASFVDTFNFDKELVLRARTFDDGRQVDTTYADGLKTSQVITDVPDLFNWVTFATDYDTAGRVTGQTRTYDDGRVLEETFENGTKTLATVTDVQDAYRWESQVTTFDLDGNVVSRRIIFDDGTERNFSFMHDVSIA